MYNILIVESQKLLRDYFELNVMLSKNYRLAASLTSPVVAEDYCAVNPVDVVLMNISSGDASDYFDIALSIKKQSPETKFIVTTTSADPLLLSMARDSWVESFCYLNYEEIPFSEFVQRTMGGERLFPNHAPFLRFGNIYSNELTERDVEIIRLVVKGLSNEEIAKTISVALQTVKNNVNSLLKKTGFTCRTALACQALMTGIVIA